MSHKPHVTANELMDRLAGNIVRRGTPSRLSNYVSRRANTVNGRIRAYICKSSILRAIKKAENPKWLAPAPNPPRGKTLANRSPGKYICASELYRSDAENKAVATHSLVAGNPPASSLILLVMTRVAAMGTR